MQLVISTGCAKNLESGLMKKIDYDVIIIGGGPAGLTSAYYLAEYGFRTVLFERKPKGELAHPCGCMVAPVKGYITFENQENGIYYKEVDFLFDSKMVVAHPRVMEFTAPNGCTFGMEVTKKEPLIFQVNKKRLLRTLADKAEAAGAEIRYNARVTGLLKEGRIDEGTGVMVNSEPVTSEIVVSAEGLSRKFCNEAGLYTERPSAYVCVVCTYVENVNLQKKGQITFVGSTYSDVPRSSVMVHTLGDDKAMVLLSVLLDEHTWLYEHSASFYLEECIKKVPWLYDMYKKGKVAEKKGCWLIVQKPATLVADRFIGVGDSAAPLGHSSIAIAMLLGKGASLTVKEALKRDDLSCKGLSRYNRWLKSRLFDGVEFEAKLVVALHQLTDEELNTMCDCFCNVNLEPFFVGTPLQQAAAFLTLLVNPKIVKNWKLISRILK